MTTRDDSECRTNDDGAESLLAFRSLARLFFLVLPHPPEVDCLCIGSQSSMYIRVSDGECIHEDNRGHGQEKRQQQHE